MTTLIDSVGRGGRNRQPDVKLVQRLLNLQNLPGNPLRVDGLMGPRTQRAIDLFQTDRVGMRSADGLVEPGRRTINALGTSPNTRGGSAGTTQPPPPPRQEPERTPAQPSGAAADRHGFVRSGVKETALTRSIIDGIAPAFRDVRAKVISGYLNDKELFWKVNYHWDYLLWMIEHAAELPVTPRQASTLGSLRAGLRACAPRPATGYRTSPVGKPEDTSSMPQMTERHKIVSQTKRTFKDLIRDADLKSKSPRTAKAFDYAVAPVAHPSTSKHGTGYALDIEGDNHRIADVCRGLGATLVFDEKSHVHVEFKNGVRRRS